MLAHPVKFLAHEIGTIETLAPNYRLILITQGDLRHHERKIAESGLAHHFDHIEFVYQ